ncbi:uncharacterized protein PHALS_05631 [Plasmopara halstedii]|uniref:Uncharacterized protein n=1 Tax=Plasmopara halstedii TaxID=4781 RepID=A0A0P1B0I4_PLAHL|nr:uncharacterized protein PHALS_05631 [Plasmopara halstedii]CEG48159.1 hypothetical protein PHALS_05631 [Plasmopara halstedii]|eukprot:XP_024584528.1 hypothetical protein PHALS_05631 [Plasmopara halstedii]
MQLFSHLQVENTGAPRKCLIPFFHIGEGRPINRAVQIEFSIIAIEGYRGAEDLSTAKLPLLNAA